ncbi:MAG: sporulation integral membrane protein YtvI [Bacillota bacterium]
MPPSERVQRIAWSAGALLLVTANLIVLGYITRYMLPIILPFLVALMISLLIEPLVRFLQERLRFPRPAAAIGVLLVLLAAVGAVLTAATLRLVAELQHLSSLLPHHIAHFRNTFDRLIDEAVTIYGRLSPAAVSYIDGLIASAGEGLEGLLTGALGTSLELLAAVPLIIIVTIITFVATYFFSRDSEKLREAWIRAIPEPWGIKSLLIVREGFGAFIRFFRAQCVLVGITMAITTTGLLIIGTPYAVSIGIVTGIFDLIPMLGPTAIFVPWIVWCVLTGSYSLAMKLFILYAILFIVRSSLEAKVVAKSLGLHPLAVLVAMYVGLKVMGILGLILGPILVVVVQGAIMAGRHAREASV